jgi:hypothetical protein
METQQQQKPSVRLDSVGKKGPQPAHKKDKKKVKAGKMSADKAKHLEHFKKKYPEDSPAMHDQMASAVCKACGQPVMSPTQQE